MVNWLAALALGYALGYSQAMRVIRWSHERERLRFEAFEREGWST
jgi:hypothetical protein